MGARSIEPGIEVVPAELEVVPSDGLNVFYDRSNEKYTVISDVVEPASPPQPQDQERRPRIWRRRKATFWLTVALSVSIVIVIIVAVVAGVLVSRNNKQKETASPTGTRVPQSIEPAVSSAETISISTTSASSAQTTSQSTDAAASSPTSSTRSSSTTSTATPKATDVSITPPLGKSAPRDCPASNGTQFTATSPYDQSASSSGTIIYDKICGANLEATNKTDLASFVVNSFDLCIQTCAGQRSSMPVSAVYHWADGTKDPEDTQRPGTCWCCAGTDPYTRKVDNCDTAIPRKSRNS